MNASTAAETFAAALAPLVALDTEKLVARCRAVFGTVVFASPDFMPASIVREKGLTPAATRRAAVMIVFFSKRCPPDLVPILGEAHRDKDIPHVLLLQRKSNMRNHPGQIAFPGGAMDAADRSLMDTALRETYEEVHF